jgi:hypothetical protein
MILVTKTEIAKILRKDRRHVAKYLPKPIAFLQHGDTSIPLYLRPESVAALIVNAQKPRNRLPRQE